MLMATEKTGNLAMVREALEQKHDAYELQSHNACVVDGRWFGVCTESRQERLACGELAEAGLVAYLPCVPKRERHGRGQLRTIWRPMLPGYVLVKCNPTPDHWSVVRTRRGVRRLLGQGSPKWISGDAVEVIKLHETEENEKEVHRVRCEEARLRAQQKGRSGIIWDFQPGERLRIKYGPMAGFYAQLETAVDEHDRIKAFVGLFGARVTAEFSAFDLERPGP